MEGSKKLLKSFELIFSLSKEMFDLIVFIINDVFYNKGFVVLVNVSWNRLMATFYMHYLPKQRAKIDEYFTKLL